MHVQFAICCDCQPSYRRDAVLILVVIIFQLFKAYYSVQEYTCINKHMVFNNGSQKKFDQLKCILYDYRICKLQENEPHDPLIFFSTRMSMLCVRLREIIIGKIYQDRVFFSSKTLAKLAHNRFDRKLLTHHYPVLQRLNLS